MRRTADRFQFWAAAGLLIAGAAALCAEPVPATISREDAKKLVSPFPYSRASIAQGKSVYVRGTCHECHDMDGKSRKGSDLAKATDLTDPKAWQFGTSEGEIFADIRDGTPAQMPGFKNLKEDQIWHLVNYVRSLWPPELQPKLADEIPKESADTAPAAAPSDKPDPAALKNPMPYTKLSIARGKGFYLRARCAECHDIDGKGKTAPDKSKGVDLTDPKTWKHGTSDGHIFTAMKKGTPEMPEPANTMQDDEFWHLVNYIRSIGPEDARPKLVEAAQ